MSGSTELEADPQVSESPILEVKGLKKHYEQSEGFLDRLFSAQKKVKALDGVDFTVGKGEIVAVVGESGCGKSTLARAIANLDRPTEGEVMFRGDDIAKLPEKQMRPYRRHIQMIFQNALASLNPRQTIRSNLKKPLEVHGIGQSDAERNGRAREELERVGLKPSHMDRYPHQFSGGQQQRIAIARGLTLEPDLLIADEPVSALDVSVQAQILNLLDDLRRDLGISIVFIAHDLSVVRHISDRVLVMYLGKIVEQGPTRELFDDPSHPYTLSLLSAVPRIDGADHQTDRVILEGTVPSPESPPPGCRFHTRCPVVIPPESWTGNQEGFKAVFLFRKRVERGNIDPGKIRSSLSSDETDVDDHMVANRIVRELLPVDREVLPTTAVDVVTAAAEAIVENNREQALELLVENFHTPCEEDVPAEYDIEDNHTSVCHRHGTEFSSINGVM